MSDLLRIATSNTILRWGTARGKDPAPLSGIDTPAGLLRVVARDRDVSFTEIFRGEPAPPRDVHGDSGPKIFEESDYRVTVESMSGRAELRHRDPNMLMDFGQTLSGMAGVLNFRSQVGRSTFSVYFDGRPEYDFEVEVFPTKLDYATDYREMLAELREIVSALSLEYLGATEHGATATTSTKNTRLDWLAILRHVIGDLEASIRQIARRPTRGMSRAPSTVPVERLRTIDSGVRRALSRASGRSETCSLGSGLRVAARVVERRPHNTLDTPEHRWLAAQLERIRRSLGRLRLEESAFPSTPRRAEVLRNLESFESRIARLERSEPLLAAGADPTPGFVSVQLLKGPGYREAYAACNMLSATLHLDGDALRISPKDVSLLYEYWCYLKLAVITSTAVGSRINAAGLFQIDKTGLRVSLKRGRTQAITFTGPVGKELTLEYNRRFTSPLVNQQPDIVLTVKEGAWPTVEVILDAKYRIDSTPEYQKSYGTPGPPEDALNVLHRYRDAIVADAESDVPWRRTVVQAAALFPYHDRPDAARFEDNRAWKSLATFGVGAIPFLPGNTQYMENWITNLLREGGWSLAERAISHVSSDAVWNARRAAAEPVLIAVLRHAAREHLEWITTEHRYYTKYTGQRRLLATRHLAFYFPASLRAPGAVAMEATVKDVEVVPRKSIATPWTPSRRSDELQVLYHLEAPRSCRPVENLHGHPFTDIRWSSRLGLARASELCELYLETEAEWRLYETLTVRGKDFSVTPGRPEVLNPDDPRGRAKFLVDATQLQYRGLEGWTYEIDGQKRPTTDPVSLIFKKDDPNKR